MENIITYKTTNLFSTPDLVSLFTSVGWVSETAAYPYRLERGVDLFRRRFTGSG